MKERTKRKCSRCAGEFDESEKGWVVHTRVSEFRDKRGNKRKGYWTETVCPACRKKGTTNG